MTILSSTPTSTRTAPEDIDRALLVLAATGNASEAARRLNDQGYEVNDRTLRNWRTRHADRYHELTRKHARDLEDIIVQQARDAAIAAGDLEQRIYQQLSDQLADLNPKDAAAAARNLATSKGINVDKLLTLTGRPNSITETRNADEILRKLQAQGVIEGDAEDEPAAFLTEGDRINARELGPGSDS